MGRGRGRGRGRGGGASYQSGLDAFSESLVGLCCGPVLAIAGCILLVWNEGRHVKTMMDIEEARDACIEVPCGTNKLSMGTYGAANGDVVYFGGCDVTQLPAESLADPIFVGAFPENDASQMTRAVEVRLWKQTCRTQEDTVGGGSTTTCEYDMVWKSCGNDDEDAATSGWNEDDSDFGSFAAENRGRYAVCHGLYTGGSGSNMPAYCYPDTMADPNCLAVSVKVGGTAAMSHDIASKLFQMGGPDVDMDTRINASSQSLQVAGQGSWSRYSSMSMEFCSATRAGHNDCLLDLGTMKVKFRIAVFDEVSMAGTLRIYANHTEVGVTQVVGSNGGTSMTYAAPGMVTKDALFDTAHEENATITMVVRILGFGIIWAGFICFFMPLAYFSDLIANCLGDIGEKLICCITCPVATCLALTMIAIGWIAYRPIIAIPFLIVALLCCGGGGYSIYKVKYMDEETKAPKYGKRSIAAKREKAEASGSVYPYPKAKKTAYDADAEKGLSTFGL